MGKSYKDLIVPAPDAVIQRVMENLDLFAKTVHELTDYGSELAKKNNPIMMTAPNFSAHPSVPLGYYDERRNNVLYVKDSLDEGKLIPKYDAILLNDGQFTKKSFANGGGRIFESGKELTAAIRAAIEGDTASAEKLKGKYTYEDRLHLYVPIDLKNWVVGIAINRMTELMRQLYDQYCADHNQVFQPETAANFDAMPFLTYCSNMISMRGSPFKNVFKEYCRTIHLPDLPVSYQVPANSPFLPGMIIYHDNHDHFKELMRAIRNGALVLNLNDNDNDYYFQTNIQHVPMNFEVVPGFLDWGFPFGLSLRIEKHVVGLEKNRRTKNNDGAELGYNEKVDNWKKSFMMLDDERRYFSQFKAGIEEKEKAYRKALKEIEYQHRVGNITATEYSNRVHGLKPPTFPVDELPIWLGLELELSPKAVDCSNAGKARVISALANSPFGDHMIVKHDGSTGTYGMEIVTVPATLAYHKEMFERNFFGVPDPVTGKKERDLSALLMSNDRCGIHVHISKRSFTPRQLGQFILFINSPANAWFIDRMAGRAPNDYCRKITLSGRNAKGVNTGVKAVLRACKDGIAKMGLTMTDTRNIHNAEARRVAVNTENGKTVEVRIFKASSDKNNVLRKLEFCEALVKFIRTNVHDDQMTPFDFINFLLDKNNRKNYKYIVRWLAAQNLVGHERKWVENYKGEKGKRKLVGIYKFNLAKLPDTIYHNSKEFKDYWANSIHNKAKEGAK